MHGGRPGGLRRRVEFARRVPGRPPAQILWYDCCEALCEATLSLVWGLRVIDRGKVPAGGPCLFVSNHQSFLDPIINGIAVRDRQLTAIARDTLFRFRPFAWLMHSYGAIRIREEGGDAAAMRAALDELAAGRCVLIYPEGSRSADGRVDEFKRGVGLLLRRARATVVPMAIDGAMDVWPRTEPRPRLRGRLGIKVGDPIPHEDLMVDGADAALARLREEIERLRLDVRRHLRNVTQGRWPEVSPGPSDPEDGQDPPQVRE